MAADAWPARFGFLEFVLEWREGGRRHLAYRFLSGAGSSLLHAFLRRKISAGLAFSDCILSLNIISKSSASEVSSITVPAYAAISVA